MLFDALLPSLERLGLPVPLGGTSNHFRRETLMALSGWDPFNVTEDADLGIRLARRGYRTRVLASTTWEEAPARFGIWLRQRTRWIKGWMQTWLVHTRDLAALRRDLPLGSRVGLHAVFGGLVVSALAQPFFYALILYQAWHGDLLAPSQGALETALLWIACGNLAVGYAISMLIGILSVLQRRRLRLVSAALLMPVYWMFIALAAYRALYQLVRAPHLWEKTPHGATAPDPRAGVLRHTSN